MREDLGVGRTHSGLFINNRIVNGSHVPTSVVHNTEKMDPTYTHVHEEGANYIDYVIFLKHSAAKPLKMTPNSTKDAEQYTFYVMR